MLKPLGKPSSSRGMKGSIICMVISLVLCLGLKCNFGTTAPSHTIGLQTGTIRLATSNFHTGNVKTSSKEEGHLKTRLTRQVQLQIEQSKEDHEDEEKVHQVGDEDQIRTNGIKDENQEKESVESKSKETEEEVSRSDIQRTTPGDQEAEKSAHKLDDDSQEAELEKQGQVGVKKSAAEAETRDSETQGREAEAEKFDGGTEEQESTDAAKLGEGETKGQDKGSIKEQWEIEEEEEQNNNAADAEGPKARVGKQKTSGRWYGSDVATEEGEVQEEVASKSREREDEDRDDKSGGQEEEYQKKRGNERGVDEESREVGAEKESEESRDEDQGTVEKMRTAERRRQKVGGARREAEEVSREEEEEEKRENEEEMRKAEDERTKEVEEEKLEEKKQEVKTEKEDPEDAIEEAENKNREEGGVEKNDRTPDHQAKKGQGADEEKLESREETQGIDEERRVAEDESKEKDEAEIRENEIEYQYEDDDRGSVESNQSTEDEIRESEGVTHVAERVKGKPPDDSLENKSETDKRQGSKGKNSDGEERWKKPQDTNKKKPTAAPKTKIKEKKAAMAEKPREMKGGKTTAAPEIAEQSAKSRKFVGKTTFTKPRAEKDTQGMMDSSAEAPEVEEEEGGAKRGRTNGRHRDRLKLRNTNSTWVSDKFIAAINSKQTEWKAGRNFRADIRSKVLKRLVGERLGSSISWSEKFHSIMPSVWTTLKGALMSYIVTPESYDLRDETDCVMRPLDTGLAATSWALSTAQSVEDRWCGTMSASPERTFSSQYLINCCDACTDQSSTNAGSPMEAYNFMQRIGIPGKDCKPYSSSPVMRTLGADAVSTKVRVPRIVNGCSSECDESDLPFVFTDLCKIRSYYYIVPGWASSIKHEIRNRGSVTAEVTVYTDFLNYKEGVYSPVEGAEPFGDLTLRLIGWSRSHSQLHWLAVGVWGKKWGDRGMVKLKAFDPRLNMESRVSVSTVDGTQCKEAQQPEVTGFTIEASDVVQRRLAKIRSRLPKARFMSSQSLVGSKKRHKRSDPKMSEERLPKQVLDWVPPGKRRRGRPVKGWRQGVDEEMLRCQLPDNLWEDRHMWRLGVVERQSAL